MDLLGIMGELPGTVNVGVSHAGTVRQLRLEAMPHPSGGWRARAPGGAWGLRCHSARTALLLEAAEILAPAGAESDAGTIPPSRDRAAFGTGAWPDTRTDARTETSAARGRGTLAEAAAATLAA